MRFFISQNSFILPDLMWKRFLLMTVLFSALVAGLGYAKFLKIKSAMAMGAKFAPPPTAVTTIIAASGDWSDAISFTGSVRAVNSLTVASEVSGVIESLPIESGTLVKKGDLLLALNDRQEAAQLRIAEARLALAQTDVARKRELKKEAAIAEADIDAAESELKQADANVDNCRSALAKRSIKAPFDGLLGIRQASLGQFLNPGAPVIALHSVNPIHAEFAVPQGLLNQVSPGTLVAASLDQSGSAPLSGKVTAVDASLDSATRNITVQATIENPSGHLKPGMFVRVNIPKPMRKDVITVPLAAIQFAPYGDSVFVVKRSTDSTGGPPTVEQQFVKTGTTRGDVVVVESGLKAGDEVVSSGVFRLRSGAPIQINNTVSPANSTAPKPPNS
jgi:membrane fusion protein (multidrug efflux system)